VQRPEAEHETEGSKDVLDPVAAKPSQVEHDDERRRRRERQRRDEERPHEEWVAGNIEALAETEQRREHEQAQRRLLDVEPLGQMGDGQPDHEQDGELPGAATPARERA